jgi:hypothetical protein
MREMTEHEYRERHHLFRSVHGTPVKSRAHLIGAQERATARWTRRELPEGAHERRIIHGENKMHSQLAQESADNIFDKKKEEEPFQLGGPDAPEVKAGYSVRVIDAAAKRRKQSSPDAPEPEPRYSEREIEAAVRRVKEKENRKQMRREKILL